MSTVSVVLPTYNERDNIIRLIDAIVQHVEPPSNIWVVDDDSADGTWQAVAERATGDPRVHLIHRTSERGLTSALARGIADSDGDIVVWMDCDFSMPPERIPALVNAVLHDGADVALGSRYVPGGGDVGHPLSAQLFSRSINLAAGLLLGFGVHDYTSGFIAARRAVLDAIELRGDYGEYCIDLLARARRRGFRVVEVPYLCVERQSGQSKTGLTVWDYLRRGSKYVVTIVRLFAT